MPKELYNEGRVVGQSSYEIYVKHALSENPNIEPASEREWLASQLGHGASMILKISEEATDMGMHYVDYELPNNSQLCAANTIIASQFFGKCKFDNLGWATKVTDYGQAISNVAIKSPTTQTDSHNYPAQTIKEFDDVEKKQLLQYIKIQDGLVLQPGAWKSTSHNNPYKDFTPDLNHKPVVRLVIKGQIEEEFYVLLTGFSNRSVLSGITGIDTGSTAEVHPENGDFLGPELYPWANKIIFTYPSIAANYLRNNLVSTNDNLKIEEVGTDTQFTVSPLRPALGISMVGPEEAGGEISIGSKISTSGAGRNYIGVTQSTSTTSHTATTNIKHSDIIAGPGIAYHKPSSVDDPVVFSSIIGSDNNFLQVTQSTKPNIDADAVSDTSDIDIESFDTGCTTLLKASPIKGSAGIKVVEPERPGWDTKLSVNISSTNSNFLKVTQQSGSTTLAPAILTNSDGLIDVLRSVDPSGNPTIKLNINEEDLRSYVVNIIHEIVDIPKSVMQLVHDSDNVKIPVYTTKPEASDYTGWHIFKCLSSTTNYSTYDCYGMVHVDNINTTGGFLVSGIDYDPVTRYIAIPGRPYGWIHVSFGESLGGSTIWNMWAAPSGTRDEWAANVPAIPFMVGSNGALANASGDFPVHLMYYTLAY